MCQYRRLSVSPCERVSAGSSADAEYRRRLELDETLESLSAAMAATYRTSGRHHYSASWRPALGEVLVAPFQHGWHRALVTDLADQLESHTLAVEVSGEGG